MSMPVDSWSNDLLEAMRQIGDVEVDPLAEKVIAGAPFDHVNGRMGYHKLLGLADLLLQAPELMLLRDSQVGKALEAMPKEFVDYFDPTEVPEWVDQAKLDRASEIWNENMIAIIGVLYAGSLPSCYLIAKGIPTLYDTGKLGQHRFIYQRIYETGLMLDAVMEPGGLHLIRDVNRSDTELGKRYVWGRGFIAARKVRLLHAAMRTMLLHPEKVLPPEAHASAKFANSSIGALTADIRLKPYDVAKLGKPVNQEDLAYTLLTFGYTIPHGLRQWGCRLSDADCEAFLHAWRLVGHIMGVRPELIPDDFAQAAAFYAKVKTRQAAPSVQGPKLMRSLTMFLQDYLPPILMRDLPLMLVGTLLTKAEVTDITPPGTRTPSLAMRFMVWFGFTFLKLYYWAKHLLIDWIPPLRSAMAKAFSFAGDALIDSWRDGYQRRPFFIPDDVGGGWHREPGIDRTVMQALRKWRIGLFGHVVKSVGLVISATLLTIITAVVMPFVPGFPWWFFGLPLLTLVCWGFGLYGLTWGVSAIVRRRPGPAEPSIMEKQPTRSEAANAS
jgi:hypothetical protein